MRVGRAEKYQRAVREWKATQIVRADEYRAAGLSFRAAAKEIGEPESTVRRWLRAYGTEAVAVLPPPLQDDSPSRAPNPVARRTRSRAATLTRSNSERVLAYKARAAAAGTALVRMERLRPRGTSGARVAQPSTADPATRAARIRTLTQKLRHRSTATVLAEQEEQLLVDFAMEVDAQGLGLTREMFGEKVRLLAGNRKNNFTDGTPGRSMLSLAGPARLSHACALTTSRGKPRLCECPMPTRSRLVGRLVAAVAADVIAYGRAPA